MLEVINKRDIEITRGDSAYLKIPLIDMRTKEPFTMTENDAARIQVRDTSKSSGNLLFTGDVIVDEDGSTLLWHIHPYNTENAVENKEYYWDGEVTLANGDNFTFVRVSKFKVLPEITRPQTIEG